MGYSSPAFQKFSPFVVLFHYLSLQTFKKQVANFVTDGLADKKWHIGEKSSTAPPRDLLKSAVISDGNLFGHGKEDKFSHAKR
jgi:hypothetical protein